MNLSIWKQLVESTIRNNPEWLEDTYRSINKVLKKEIIEDDSPIRNLITTTLKTNNYS